MRAKVEGHDVVRILADNPGALTLSGSNTWVVGRDPAWVVDAGPALEDHVAAVVTETRARGGCGGIAITHGHIDHFEAVPALLDAFGEVPVAGMSYGDTEVADGDEVGPFTVVAVPGHAADHVAFLCGSACFTGDAVLGEGSVFVTADMRGYLDALRRLRALDLDVILPGHGPPVHDPAAKLDEYIEHRLDRERRLIAALDSGLSTEEELLDAVWDDVPPQLRAAAAVTLRAHLAGLDRD